jgi:hypothetical protein
MRRRRRCTCGVPLNGEDATVRDRLPLLIGLTLLALALLIGSFAIAGGIRDRGKNQVITVTGSAKQRITSDYVVWDVSVTSQEFTAREAAKKLEPWTKQIRGFLTARGIQSSELTVQPVSTEAQSDDQSSIIGYRVTRSFQVRSRRVDAVAAVAEASSRLISAGIPLQAEPVQYIYTRLADVRPALLAQAVRDARNRGRVLLGAAGGKLGKLRGVDVGVFQVTAPNSTSVSDYGEYDTTTLRKDVTAVVNVTFALE